MIRRMLTKTLRYLGILKPQRRGDVSMGRYMSIAEYESINTLPDAQVAHFLEYLKRQTEIHATLLADISPPADPLNAAEEGEEIARIISNFIMRYLVKNGLRTKGLGLAETGMGQLRGAAAEWAKENLRNTEGATR
ncbi:hypothetical protein [Loktanella salsilacus]|jgi:hypothetical protein|uniref:hypothetical protein n=1 Tax=Loktanella salsilacus TaxID=195913 RepID=UPI0020B8836C|nr:hypothetical protein [Loktanella salsilacus]UTH43544.1 hypothetical protein KBK07_10460 [Loktanella salsilacus]